MKKFVKLTAGIALAAAFATTAGVLAGCSNNPSGEAYGLTHGAGFVGYAKVVKNGDAIKDVTLTEVCLPTHVKNTETDEYYQTVSYGSVTLTYSAADSDYKVGDVTFKKYLETEANCKAYYEAVIGNNISVTVGTEQKKNIMTKATLSKEENGYWSTSTNVGESKVEGDNKWKANRDATVKYVKDNGVAKLKDLAKITEDNANKGFWTDGTIVTGATWNDLNPTDKKGKVYYSYAELIIKAYEAVK